MKNNKQQATTHLLVPNSEDINNYINGVQDKTKTIDHKLSNLDKLLIKLRNQYDFNCLSEINLSHINSELNELFKLNRNVFSKAINLLSYNQDNVLMQDLKNIQESQNQTKLEYVYLAQILSEKIASSEELSRKLITSMIKQLFYYENYLLYQPEADAHLKIFSIVKENLMKSAYASYGTTYINVFPIALMNIISLSNYCYFYGLNFDLDSDTDVVNYGSYIYNNYVALLQNDYYFLRDSVIHYDLVAKIRNYTNILHKHQNIDFMFLKSMLDRKDYDNVDNIKYIDLIDLSNKTPLSNNQFQHLLNFFQKSKEIINYKQHPFIFPLQMVQSALITHYLLKDFDNVKITETLKKYKENHTDLLISEPESYIYAIKQHIHNEFQQYVNNHYNQLLSFPSVYNALMNGHPHNEILSIISFIFVSFTIHAHQIDLIKFGLEKSVYNTYIKLLLNEILDYLKNNPSGYFANEQNYEQILNEIQIFLNDDWFECFKIEIIKHKATKNIKLKQKNKKDINLNKIKQDIKNPDFLNKNSLILAFQAFTQFSTYDDGFEFLEICFEYKSMSHTIFSLLFGLFHDCNNLVSNNIEINLDKKFFTKLYIDVIMDSI